MKSIARFLSDESGATAIEYGLIAAVISIVILASVRLIGTNIKTKFSAIASALR